MSKILLIDNNEGFRIKLKESFEGLENEFVTAHPGDEGIQRYIDYNPDLVLMNYAHCADSAYAMIKEIIEFDATACIVSMLNEDVEDKVHQMYLKGARAVIKVPKELNTKGDVKVVMDQMLKICDELKFAKCVGCWKTNRFTSTIKLN